MLWKKFSQFWNNLSLHHKLMSMILSTLLVFFLLFFFIIYRNVEQYSQNSYQNELEKSLQSAENALNSQIIRLNNSILMLSNNSSVENVLHGQYTSRYQFYYDLKYQFDSTIAGIKLVCPEIKKVDIYMKERSNYLARSSFHDYSEFEEIFPDFDFNAVTDPVWVFRDSSIYLLQALYSSYNIDNYAVLKMSVHPDSFFSAASTDAFRQPFLFVVTDKENTSICQKSSSESFALKKSLSVSAELLNGWKVSLSIQKPELALSTFTSNQEIILLFFSAIVIFCLLRLLISRTILRRITKLNQYVHDVVDNQFTNEIICNDLDEIGDIIRNINNMAGKTRQLIDKVYKSQIEQKEAQIRMLQAQINPHFLYNTLSVLNWNALKHHDTETSRIITDLSAFYRTALNVSAVTTTIGEEINFIKNYINIKKITCTHPLQVRFDIPDSLIDYELPRIILQPIVENAIDHGIEELPFGREGMITIEAEESDEEIVIRIADNGVGMTEEQMTLVLLPQTRGYGLHNVNERLKLFFDDIYGIRLSDNQSSGLLVTLRIPKYISLS